MAPLFYTIFNQPPQKFPQETIEALKYIGDLYMKKHSTYIKIFWCTFDTHILPMYIPHRVIVRETSYHIVEAWITTFLSASEKENMATISHRSENIYVIEYPPCKEGGQSSQRD
jgi:hypothetical protein